MTDWDPEAWTRNLIADMRANGGRPSSGPMAGKPLIDHDDERCEERRDADRDRDVPQGWRSLGIAASKSGAPSNPAWYHNLIAHPEVDDRGRQPDRPGPGDRGSGAERDRLWDDHVAADARVRRVPEEDGPGDPDVRAREAPVEGAEPGHPGRRPAHLGRRLRPRRRPDRLGSALPLPDAVRRRRSRDGDFLATVCTPEWNRGQDAGGVVGGGRDARRGASGARRADRAYWDRWPETLGDAIDADRRRPRRAARGRGPALRAEQLVRRDRSRSRGRGTRSSSGSTGS